PCPTRLIDAALTAPFSDRLAFAMVPGAPTSGGFMSVAYRLARPLLFALDAETAHGLSLKALQLGLADGPGTITSAVLASRVAGIDFPNPIGLAAGYDKNAQVPDALLRLGFGFVEAGTVTPRPQAGNPRPRIFRLVDERAVINRLGFNNDGH